MAQAVAGTALVAGGAAVLNQVYERDTDALMRRTRLRPLPDGRVSPRRRRASSGSALSIAGLLLLARARQLAGGGAGACDARRLPDHLHADEAAHAAGDARRRGAGRAAAAHRLDRVARRHRDRAAPTLFAIVFLWQIPHFMAIAWLYRDDYGKAGFPMLPVIEPDGRRAGRQAVLYAAALVPVSLAPTSSASPARSILVGRLVLGLALLVLAARFAIDAQRAIGARAVLWIDHLSAAPVDCHDRR